MFTRKRICRSLWILLGSPGSPVPKGFRSADTMKDTSVNAFQQYAAFNLGCVGTDLLHQFREIANCSSVESNYYSDEVGSLRGVKDPLSVAEHAIKGLLQSTPQESSLADALQAALIKCNQLQTELLEFLLPDQNTLESIVASGLTAGIKRKWSEVTERFDAIDDLAPEISETEWRTAKEEILEVIDSCLLGFPETLSEIEAQLPAELKPFTKLARRLSELREQRKTERKNTNDKILRMYFVVLETVEPELRPLFDDCVRLQPALRPIIPVRIDDERIEASLFEIRASIAKKLSEQDSLETSFLGLQHPASLMSDNTVQAAAQLATHIPEIVSPQCQIPESKQEEDAQQSSEVALQSEFKWELSMDGVRINGIEVILKSDLELGILEYLCGAKQRANAETLSAVLGSSNSSDPSGIKAKLTIIRSAIRAAFDLGTKVDPIPPRSRNKPGEWQLDKKLLVKRANELLDQESRSPEKDTNL